MERIKELKAEAYDLIGQIQYLNGKLHGINKEILEETQKIANNGTEESLPIETIE